MKKDTATKPLKWWITLIIAILSAIAGSISENVTGFVGGLF